MTVDAPVLMVVTDPSIPDMDARVREALAGGATWIQYRDKSATSAERVTWVRAFKHDDPHALLLVNDDEAAALEGGADGVHWPAYHRPAAYSGGAGIRPRGGLTGRSLHQSDLPDPPISGLDYVVFGTVFETDSHAGAHTVGLDGLTTACRLPLPVLAIGGITAENAGDCIRAGAAGVAVIRSVLMAKDPARAATEILQAMREAQT